MTDREQRRAIGDRSAGRGAGFESPYRARLLMELGPNDTLELYSVHGEDADVVRDNGHRTVHQVKSGRTSGAHKIVADVLADAERALTVGQTDRFVLATEEPLDDRAGKALRAAQQSNWGRGRLEHRRVPSAEDARLRAGKTLTEALTRDAADLAGIVYVPEVEALIDALVACENELRVPSDGQRASINGREVAERIGLPAMRTRWTARLIGDRLEPWQRWITEAAEAGDAVFAAWALALSAPWAAVTDAEAALLVRARDWLKGPRNGTVQLISGRSGTGKTWTLARVASALTAQADVYILNDRAGSEPDLVRLAVLSDRPVVVVVDDLRQEDVASALRRSQAARGLLVLAAAGAVKHAGQIDLSLPRDVADLVDDLGDRVVHYSLPETVTTNDRRALAAASGRHLSYGLEERLRQGNLRLAAAVLNPGAPRSDLARLSRLGRDEHWAPWALPLLWTSAAGARLPLILLSRYARDVTGSANLPAAVDAMLLRRDLTDGGALVWFEEQASAAVLARLAKDQDPDDVRATRQRALTVLLGLIDPGRPRERAFARLLLRGLSKPDANAIIFALQEHLAVIVEADSAESYEDLAYGWLRILGPVGAGLALRRAAAAARPPRDAADVIVLAAALGDSTAAKAVLNAIPDVWDLAPWEAVFEALQGLPASTARRVRRLAVAAADRHTLDTDGLLRSGRASRSFAKAVADVGSPGLRRRVHELLGGLFTTPDPPLGLIDVFFELTERCVMQKRSLLALDIIRRAASGPVDPGRLAEAEQRAALIAAEERDDDLIGATLNVTLDLARELGGRSDGLTRAGAAWASHCSFARRWARHDLGGYLEALTIARALDEAAPGQAPRVFLEAARGLVNAGPAEATHLAPLLDWFAHRRRSLYDARAFLVLAGALAGCEDETTALAVAWYLRRLAVGPADKTRVTSNQLGRQLSRWTRQGRQVLTPAPLLFLPSHDDLLTEYLVVIRHADRAGMVPSGVIAKLVEGRSPLLHVFAFNELYRRRERPPLAAMREQLRRAGVSEDRPESIGRQLAFEARYGSLDEARRLVLVMCDLQERKHHGANPHTAHRALVALADREEGMTAEMYRLAVKLTYIHALGSSAEPENPAAVSAP
jgi:hypothetical protein